MAFGRAQDPAQAPLARVTGKGVQIYRCTSATAWTFAGPEAVLSLDGEHVGTHGAGPRWTWKDGSSVTGKVEHTTPSADPANVPDLVLLATPDPAHRGFLSSVTRIERTETKGGAMPADGCKGHDAGDLLRIAYSATYSFWTR